MSRNTATGDDTLIQEGLDVAGSYGHAVDITLANVASSHETWTFCLCSFVGYVDR